MEVDVQVERASEALNEGNCSRVEFGSKALLLGFFLDESSDCPVGDLQGFGLDFWVLSQDEANGHRKGENVLANTDSRKDLVYEMSSRFSHSSATARGAETSLFARKCQEFLMLALAAFEPEKAMGQDPAAKEGVEFFFDVTRQRPSFSFGHSLEGAKILSNSLVENRLLGTSLTVVNRKLGKAELGAHGRGAEA